MQKKIPALLIIFILFVPLCAASGSWFFGIGMHKRAWLSSQDAVSYWTIQDKSGYLLTLNQQAMENPQSIVLSVRNTIPWQGALIDGIARYSFNTPFLHGLYLGFGPRLTTNWGSLYLNLGGVLAGGGYRAEVKEAPSAASAEGLPGKGDFVNVSFLGLVPAMESGLDFEIGKLGINLAYSFISQKKIDKFNYTFAGEPIALKQIDGYLAPVLTGGSFLSCSVLYRF